MNDNGEPVQAGEENDRAVRDPETFGEMLIANMRPQPAIPAVLVFAISVFIPVFVYDSGDSGSAFQWLIPVGILISCGLAVAAGFCSLFPQIAWIALAAWAMKFTLSGPLPVYNRTVLATGIAIAAAMIVFQIWRVATGKFRPTIRVDIDDS